MDSRWDFDRWAATYDQSVAGGWIHQDYEKVIDYLSQTIIDYSKIRQVNVLDIGAGTGNLEAKLSNIAGLTIDVVEPSEGMRTELRKKCPGIRILEGQLPNLPRFDKQYDIIVSSYVIHHVYHDKTGMMIENICKNLNRGGLLLLADVMFESEAEMNNHINNLKAIGQHELIEDIVDEPFQFIDQLRLELSNNSMQIVNIEKFTLYTFSILAKSAV